MNEIRFPIYGKDSNELNNEFKTFEPVSIEEILIKDTGKLFKFN